MRLAKELMDVNYEISMVSKLLDKSQSELDYNRLKSLQPYLSVIVKKLGELHGKKVQLERQISKLKPPFIKFIDSVNEHINQIKDLLKMVYHGKLNLNDFWNKISALRENIPKMLEGLKKSRDIIDKIKQNAPEEVQRFLETKIQTINSLSEYLDRLSRLVSLDPSKILKYKKNVGKTIIIEPIGETCIISEVYIDASGHIFLEVAKEEEIDSGTLEALYQEIGFDFAATDILDFKDKLLRRMQSRLKIRSLQPSIIKSFLREEGLLSYLSRETMDKLKPKYAVVGYSPINKIASTPMGFKVNESDLIKKRSTLIRCPSVKLLPEGVVGKILKLENRYYLIATQTFIPMLGRVLVCLQQDVNGEPLPNITLLEKIFAFLIKKEAVDPDVKKYATKALKFIKGGKNIDDAYWTLRILIMRAGLKTSRKITESTALRPSHVFSYCLQNSIPLLFQEIVANYIYLIETDYIEIEGKEPKAKIYITPKPFFEAFNVKLLNMLIGNICHEPLGILSENDKLILVCAPPISQDIIKKKSEEYGMPLDFAQTASKLIRTLIYFGKIKSLTEYRALLDEINVQMIIYNELVKGFEENDELIAAHSLFLKLMRGQ